MKILLNSTYNTKHNSNRIFVVTGSFFSRGEEVAPAGEKKNNIRWLNYRHRLKYHCSYCVYCNMYTTYIPTEPTYWKRLRKMI